MIIELLNKTEIQVALIAAVTTICTVIGSIYAVNSTNSSQLELKRIDSIRDMKRTYYNALAKSFALKLMYNDVPDSIEKVEAEMNFLKEANRLPLYASQEMIEFIEKMKDPKLAANTKISDFYIIMRNDLYSTDFKPFDSQFELSITMPHAVIITDPQGNKQIWCRKK